MAQRNLDRITGAVEHKLATMTGGVSFHEERSLSHLSGRTKGRGERQAARNATPVHAPATRALLKRSRPVPFSPASQTWGRGIPDQSAQCFRYWLGGTPKARRNIAAKPLGLS
jgi:hypothetical protein